MKKKTLTAHSGYAGWFKIEAFRVDADGNEIPGSRRVAADWFPNLITNAGLDFLGTTGSVAVQEYVRVGSGNATPLPTDTALVSQVAASNTQQANTYGVNRTGTFYAWRRRTVRFAAGSMGGSAVNLAEVAVSPAAASALFSRALILDGGGVPTTISVQTDEVLDVTYELRLYPTLADATGSVVIAGVTYAWVARPLTHVDYDENWGLSIGCGINFNDTAGNFNVYGPQAMAALPAQNSKPTGAVVATTMTAQAYVAGSYQRSFEFGFGLNEGNVAGGIGAFFATQKFQQAGGAWVWGLTPKLPKNNQSVSTFTVSLSWGRYTP